MKSRIVTALTLMSVAALLFLPALKTSAASYYYNKNNLVSDEKFTNYKAMSAASVQSFLNSKNSGLKNVKGTEHCSSVKQPYHWTYFSHCGKQVSAATIIYEAGRAYHISQKAILATLQKEQSLVTDPSPSSSQVNCAMGYNSCSGYSGFFRQVDNGAWQLREYIESMSGRTWWGTSFYPCHSSGIQGPPPLFHGPLPGPHRDIC